MLGGLFSPTPSLLTPTRSFLGPSFFFFFLDLLKRGPFERDEVCSFRKGPGSKEPTVSGLCAPQRGPQILVQLTLSVLSSEKGFWEGSWSIPPPMLKPRIKFSP